MWRKHKEKKSVWGNTLILQGGLFWSYRDNVLDKHCLFIKLLEKCWPPSNCSKKTLTPSGTWKYVWYPPPSTGYTQCYNHLIAASSPISPKVDQYYLYTLHEKISGSLLWSSTWISENWPAKCHGIRPVRTPVIYFGASCLWIDRLWTLADTKPRLTMDLNEEELRGIIEEPIFVDLPCHTTATLCTGLGGRGDIFLITFEFPHISSPNFQNI